MEPRENQESLERLILEVRARIDVMVDVLISDLNEVMEYLDSQNWDAASKKVQAMIDSIEAEESRGETHN